MQVRAKILREVELIEFDGQLREVVSDDIKQI